ncbi:MAG TPA: hypothetical protein VMU73_01790, partial [Gaiellaceae bacterium]|nr:hypothetical protein [Gaiellaceae bacterium]
MSGRLSKSRQEPLGPDETFSALVTRLIITNRAERATRAGVSPTTLSASVEPRGDRLGEPRGGS